MLDKGLPPKDINTKMFSIHFIGCKVSAGQSRSLPGGQDEHSVLLVLAGFAA